MHNRKSVTGQRTFYFRTVSLWNNIETGLKLYDSVVNFKNMLKYNLLQNIIIILVNNIRNPCCFK